MDYFFWDEIFGTRQNLVDALLEEPRAPEDERVSVIIAYVETFQGPQSS